MIEHSLFRQRIRTSFASEGSPAPTIAILPKRTGVYEEKKGVTALSK